MQILANGLIAGLQIALLGLAFAVVYVPTRVFHVAMAGVYAVVPFVAWIVVDKGLPWVVAAPLAVGVGCAISMACETFNHARLERKSAPLAVHLIASLGIYILLVQIVTLLWGPETRVLRSGVDATWVLGSVVITHAQAVQAGWSVLLLLLFYLWLRHTGLGLRLRAMADNPDEIGLRGYNVRALRRVAFLASGLLAGSAALLVAYDLGFSAVDGLPALLLGVVAMVVGGQGSFLTPALGGVLLGVVRSEVVWFLSARWQDGATFLVLALIVLTCPQGLLGRVRRLEAVS